MVLPPQHQTRPQACEAPCHSHSPALLRPCLVPLGPYMFHPPSSSSSLSESAQLIPADDNHPSSIVSLPAATASVHVAATSPPEPFHHLPIHCFLFPARPGRRSQLRNLVHALLMRSLAELARASARIPQAVTCQFWTDLHHVITTWRPPVQAQLAPSPPRPARPAQRSSRRRRKLPRRLPSSSTSPPTKRPRRSLSSSAPVPLSPSLVSRFYSTIRGTVSRLGTFFTPAGPPQPLPRRGPSRAAKKSQPWKKKKNTKNIFFYFIVF